MNTFDRYYIKLEKQKKENEEKRKRKRERTIQRSNQLAKLRRIEEKEIEQKNIGLTHHKVLERR